MYARFGRFRARTGKRDALVEILTRAARRVGELPGCRLYLVHEDPADEDAVVIYELWDDEAAHGRSLERPGIRALIGEARPLIDGPPEGGALRFAGGHGA